MGHDASGDPKGGFGKLRQYGLAIFLIALVALAAILIYHKLHPYRFPPNLIAGTGRIDGDLVNLGTKYPGRVEEIADDGTPVHRGMVIARIGSREQRA
ncbi:hypothetical protein [Nitratifractor sp.]